MPSTGKGALNRIRRCRFHQPDARPSRLSQDDGRLRPGEVEALFIIARRRRESLMPKKAAIVKAYSPYCSQMTHECLLTSDLRYSIALRLSAANIIWIAVTGTSVDVIIATMKSIHLYLL